MAQSINEQLEWRLVTPAAIEIYRKSASTASSIRGYVAAHHKYAPLELWWSPAEEQIWVDTEKCGSELRDGLLSAVDGISLYEGQEAPESRAGWLKASRAKPIPALNRISTWLNWGPGKYFGTIPNHPSPLGALIAGGLVGGGLGYGAGWLGEKLLPADWKRKNLRRTLMLLGAGLGTVPGLAKAYTNMQAGKGMLDTYPYMPEPKKWSLGAGPALTGKENEPNVVPNYAPAPVGQEMPQIKTSSIIATTDDIPWAVWTKASSVISRTGLGYSGPSFDINQFRHTLWNDPSVSHRLPVEMQAAADGLVSGASQLAGGTKIITPMDMGRMALGMGSGYISGALVGKGLGLLMGAPPSVQRKLKTTGTWAGVVANLVPLAFGG